MLENGNGGGFSGAKGSTIRYTAGEPGNQETGNSFGVGASGFAWVGSGGGGFYGGGVCSGGSGYIKNELLTNKKMVMYSTNSNYENDNPNTKTEITTNVDENAKSDFAKIGNGYIRITFLGEIS